MNIERRRGKVQMGNRRANMMHAQQKQNQQPRNGKEVSRCHFFHSNRTECSIAFASSESPHPFFSSLAMQSVTIFYFVEDFA